MQTWCYGWDLLGPPLFVYTDSDGLLKLKFVFVALPTGCGVFTRHQQHYQHLPPPPPPPNLPFLLFSSFSDISVSKNLPQTQGHRENRDLMHASSEDLFADPLQVRGRLLAAGGGRRWLHRCWLLLKDGVTEIIWDNGIGFWRYIAFDISPF